MGRWFALIAGLILVVGLTLGAMSDPALAQQTGAVEAQTPAHLAPPSSDSALWRAVREGVQGQASNIDPQAGVLIQSEGDNWRAFRNGPLSTYGTWALLGMIVLLALFFALRGRIKIEHGFAGRTILRFTAFERFTHWITAGSFVVLAFTGLNLLYGRYFLLPLIGPEAFSVITQAGKIAHNYVAFAFMIGLVLMFVLWVRYNIPSATDLKWIAKGGGLFAKGVHPPSKKFNAGQKLIFWITILGGFSLSLSGVALMFPYEFAPFEKTFVFLNQLGFSLPTGLTLLQEMQLSSLWHAIVSIFMITVIIAHIYIGSVGMQGAFDAMGTGQVDENWAREHHNLWVEEVTSKKGRVAGPAE